MKQNVIIELSTPELIEKIEIEKEKYAKMRMGHVVSQLENPMEMRYTRKTIARLTTELRKRELQGETK